MKSVKSFFILLIIFQFILISCNQNGTSKENKAGIRIVEITTPKGNFKVWTQRVGDNPRIKVLLLHGGPGCSHEYLEIFDKYFPKEGFEYYYYDQLGSYFSDQPNDTSLWNIDRFVEEVEQVRKTLGLNKDNFYLLGHSWGGALAIEYALKYQKNLKGLIISNMMASIPRYNQYADDVLAKQMPPEVLKEIKAIEATKDYDNPRYEELLNKYFYPEHVLRMKKYPDAVKRGFEHCNMTIYTLMQGPSEFGASGKLLHWDRSEDLDQIKVPTLVIGAQYGTMDPDYLNWMAVKIPNGHFLYCMRGSHLAMWDDQAAYFAGLDRFIKGVDEGKMWRKEKVEYFDKE